MSRQFWVEQVAQVVADGTAVANTASETRIFPDVTIPANYMQDGRTLRLTAYGKLSTTGTPTITFTLRSGTVGNGLSGTILAITEAITNGSGVSNVNWHIELTIQTRVNGSSGTLFVMGKAFVHTAAGTVVVNIFGVSGFDAPAGVTVDLTVARDLCLTATWSAASPSNTLTGTIETLESTN